ncbi:C-type lectin protein [Cokeromyces recurvatus]|uniref:C-type lectin protein n=1 Tax=Cokeromyces recurvatus TaxID=90255 RepID=UPI00221FC17F|nr:C-type lectin protein [Cokeromyces recurvatus]KAI7900048.1 C-type lectin protein [Cokeromyces recurvatus]
MLVKSFSGKYELKFRSHQVEGPASPRDYMEWISHLKKWRLEQHNKKENLTTSSYDISKLQWVQASYVQPHVMMNDLFLFDPKTNKFTVDKFVNDIEERYGKVDSVVVWPAFPNLGCDSRNSEDYFRCLPGGTTAIRGLVEEFHMKNIKVIFPILNWDNGTRDPQASWSYILPRLFKEYNVDGMSSEVAYFTQDYWTTSLAIGHPLVFQSEANSSNRMDGAEDEDNNRIMQWNTMDMAKYDTKLHIPTVATRKFVEPRHMTHTSDKWSRNKTFMIQHAFFNGLGIELWENIFGTWNALSPRDSEAIRRTSSILRCFGPDFFSSPEWEPHCPCVHYETVFASKFPSQSVKEQTVWTFINRGPIHVKGHQIVVNYHIGLQFYNVWLGSEMYPTDIVDGLATLSFDIEPYGYGCIFAACDVSPLPKGLDALLKSLNHRSRTPLYQHPICNSILWQELDEVVVSKYNDDRYCGMVRIEGDIFNFRVNGLCSHPNGPSEYTGIDIKYPWEFQPSRTHAPYRMKINTFYMDAYPVTESQFKNFLDESGYKPTDPTNFLKHWIGGCYPADRANKPIIHVSIEDARAYAKWAGKRLPHEWEWQFVAQGGTEYRKYPWGNEWDETMVPKVYNGRERLYPDHPPADVDAHPSGRSPLGVYDLVGNVWQWTDVYQDSHTRSAIIRGGSYYQPKNGERYFSQAYSNYEHGKYLLMAPSIDRSATIGFRCVKDTVESAASFGNCLFFDDPCF